MIGDAGGDYKPLAPLPTTYTISATPFSKDSARGIKGDTMTVKIKVGPGVGTANLGPPTKAPTASPQGCAAKPNRRACRRSKCIWAQNQCKEPSNAFCVRLNQRACRRHPACALKGTKCQVKEKQNDAEFQSCDGMSQRVCRRTPGCAVQGGICVATNISGAVGDMFA